MELDHEFTVPVPVDRAWPILLDVQRIAPCVPGATLDSIEAEEFQGRLKVKLGAMTITYRGSARIVSADEASHTVSIEGSAKEARGSGTASVTVQAQLHDDGGQTRVTVHTKLNVTGRPAQFGRNILSEVGAKLIERFADALAEELQAPESKPEAAPADVETGESGEIAEDPPVSVQPLREREDAIDLFEVAGPSVAKRAVPVAAGAVVLFAIVRVIRRRRGRHHR
jgi:carbon monoxide dehydrogenase subunit G